MSTTVPSETPPLPSHVLGYRALKLWQRALDLAADAHRLARAFPEADQPGLAAELRRAAAAVPSAVAASALAVDRADQHRALQSATAGLARVETLAALAERVGVVSSGDASGFLFTSGDVTRLLRGLLRSNAARANGAQAAAEPGGVGVAAPGVPAVRRVAEAACAAEAAPEAPSVSDPAVAAPVPAADPVPPPSMRVSGRRRAGTRGAKRTSG